MTTTPRLSPATLARFVLVIGPVLGLSGCASVDGQRAALADAAPCCAAIPAGGITSMKASPVTVTLDERAPVAAFSTGNSRYRVLDLGGLQEMPPAFAIRSTGTVTNVYAGGQSWGPVVYPAATFLDAQRQVLGTFTEDRPANPSLDCQALLHCGFAMIVVTPPARARYLVLHTPYAKVGQTRVEPVPGRAVAERMLVVGTTPVIVPGGTAALRTIGMSTGDLEVRALAATPGR